MELVHHVVVPQRPVAALEGVIGAERYTRLVVAAQWLRQRLAGRTIWNINSTATGGGVAEMLQVLVGYVNDLDIPIRWSVIGGTPEFFVLTKRLHNLIHGVPGAALSEAEAAVYSDVLAANANDLLALVRSGDIVLLHDPQTAGLVAPLAAAGARVVWRCHVGLDRQTDATRAAWRFLRPHLLPAHAYVFSRRSYPPAWVPERLTWIIPPSIDPFSPKNQDLSPAAVAAILARIGVLDGPAVQDGAAAHDPGRFTRRDGVPAEVNGTGMIIAEELPGLGDPVVVQVSRWDRLKDMAGVMRGFAEHVAPVGPGHLMLVGPSVGEVTDDPEGAAVFAECVAGWRQLPAATRARAMLVTLPLDDIDENGAMVNALQRHATVVVQKSLAEGFGLTVAEAMWKGRPVVGSAVGGIIDQIADGTGVLLPDPTDLAAFGAAVRRLLTHPERARRMGEAARAYVRDHYVGDVHLLRYAELFATLI